MLNKNNFKIYLGTAYFIGNVKKSFGLPITFIPLKRIKIT